MSIFSSAHVAEKLHLLDGIRDSLGLEWSGLEVGVGEWRVVSEELRWGKVGFGTRRKGNPIRLIDFESLISSNFSPRPPRLCIETPTTRSKSRRKSKV